MKKRVLQMQTKLVLFVLFAVIMPFILLALQLFLRQMQISRGDIISNAQAELRQITARMNVELTRFSSISNLFYLDPQLASTMDRYNSGQLTLQELKQEVSPISKQYNAVLAGRSFNMAIVLQDGTMVGDAFRLCSPRHLDVSEHPWHVQLQRSQTRIVWTTDSELDKLFSPLGTPGIYFIRSLHLQDSWSHVGTLILYMPGQEMRKIMSSYTAESQNIYLLDQDLRVISYEDNLGLGTLPIDRSAPMLAYDGYETWLRGSGEYLTTYELLQTPQWRVVTCSSLTILLGNLRRSMSYYMVSAICYILIVCSLVYFFTRRFLRPVTVLHQNMARVQAGDLSVYVPVRSQDEIGELTAQFNSMVAETARLVDQVVAGEEKKREAEIDALQSQINPHFLYNTLASIRYMIATEEKGKADKVVLSLIRLMRNVLSDSREYVTVRAECNLLKEYINIQQLVFGKPLEVILDVQEEILRCNTIKLLLQPIVENAIQHGLKPSIRPCVLRITGRAQSHTTIAFTVSDNGVGFQCPPDLLSRGPGYDRKMIGLRNVHSRIRLNFGEAYGLSIQSEIDVGTTVTIRVPRMEEEGAHSTYEHTDR